MTNWDEAVAPEVERFAEALLDSATADAPSDAAFRRTAAVLGLGSLLGSGALLVSGAARASSGMFAKVGATTVATSQGSAAAAGSTLVLAKWAGTGLLVGITTVGVSQAVFPRDPASELSAPVVLMSPSVQAPALSVRRLHGRAFSHAPPEVAAAAPSQAPSELEVEAVVPAVRAESRSSAQLRSQANAKSASENHVADVVSASLASVESLHLSAPAGEGVGGLGKDAHAGAGPSRSHGMVEKSAGVGLPVAQAAFAAPPKSVGNAFAPTDGLQEEVRLVDALRAAVVRRDEWSLWALLTKYDREHPRGELRAEVAAIRARALSGSR
ncbi:MAG: hypothetical protein SFV15_25180 [Polyangiaceae bacterium]|nr:hypothetical protein [Polyangiaceae bacterium]